MPNTIYNHFLAERDKGNIDLDAPGAVIRVMLEKSTSGYSRDFDHKFVSDLTGNGFVEIETGATPSYARQSVAGLATTQNDTSDRSEVTFNAVSFGNLESGATVKGYVLFIRIGPDDTTPGDDILWQYVDTATGLPAVLGGGEFLITPPAGGVMQTIQTPP